MYKKKVVLSVLTILAALPLITAPAFAKRAETNRQVVKGTIAQLTQTSVTIKGSSYTITPRTRFEDFSGAPVTADAFKIGDCVKVQVNTISGAPVVREIELEDHCSDTTRSDASDDASHHGPDDSDHQGKGRNKRREGGSHGKLRHRP